MKRIRAVAVLVGFSLVLGACDPERTTRPIIMKAKPPLIEHQFCLALLDAERRPQDSMVIKGIAVHGYPDTFTAMCDGEEHVMEFTLAPASDDDFGMKELRKAWNKRTGAKDPICSRCPKYDIRAKFVGMVKKDESGKLVFVAQTADEVRRIRIRK